MLLQYTGRVMMFLMLISASIFVAYDLARRFLSVNGKYSDWSPYSECSKTCGNAKRVRFRTCSNPPPRFSGQNCSRLGEATEIILCDVPPCPVDGIYSEWRKWSVCSAPCGVTGEEIRTRKCANPFPRNGGKTCLEQGMGPEIEKRTCNEPCPVHGGYSQWSEFTDCNLTCGGGQRTRTRKCDNPVPENGGRNCIKKLGPDTETEACNTQACPGNAGNTNGEV